MCVAINNFFRLRFGRIKGKLFFYVFYRMLFVVAKRKRFVIYQVMQCCVITDGGKQFFYFLHRSTYFCAGIIKMLIINYRRNPSRCSFEQHFF